MYYFDKDKQRWIVEISRMIKTENGSTRVRKRKVLPKGASKADAANISASMDAAVVEKAFSIRGVTGWDSYVDGMLEKKGSWIYQALARCKNTMSRKNRTGGCTLTPELIAAALKRSKGRCEVTGIAFKTERALGVSARPFMHSIDRIDSKQGYVPNNIRIVCLAVNVAMSHWGENVLSDIAVGYVLHKYSSRFVVAREVA